MSPRSLALGRKVYGPKSLPSLRLMHCAMHTNIVVPRYFSERNGNG